MMSCNLIPEPRRVERRVRTIRARWGAVVTAYALLAAGACVALTAMANPSRAVAATRSIQALDRDHEQIRRELMQLKSQLVATRRHLERSAMIAAHPNFSPLLALLARERRGDVVLESCNLRAGAIVASSNPIERRPQEYVLTISGLAREAKGISAYAAALEATPAFDTVTIQEMRGRGDRAGGKGVGFSLRCVLREATPTGSKP
jgi:Tfp pilus assembly protein PilN